ncbi:MAG: NUDIX hydrolase [Actinomycetota bacterium]
MYVTRSVLDPIESRFGVPVLAVAAAEFKQPQFDLVARCIAKNRAHDVTLFIHDDEGRFAVARKHSYPPDVFRPPSGGVEPGESFAAGALREAVEETGLEIALERYVLRVEATFTCAGASAPWVSHVVLARCVRGILEPTDRKEIAEARWATVDELVNRYRPGMLAIGSAGMRYRVDLQDFTLELLGLAAPISDPGRVTRLLADPASLLSS